MAVSNFVKKIPKSKKAKTIYDQEWTAHGMPVPEKEYKFYENRKWRFDLAWPKHMIAVEIEGIFYRENQGTSRHQTGPGYADDLEKYNYAEILGWRVLRFLPGKVDFAMIGSLINNTDLILRVKRLKAI